MENTDSWLGPLSALFRAGSNKDILHLQPDQDLLFRELAKEPLGYLIAQPRLVETLFYDSDVFFLAENGTEMFIPISEEAEKGLRAKFAAARIPVRSTYSSEEVGYIGTECKDYPETFHVVQSNVIVEVDNRDSVVVGDNRLGRVLVSHLHSYATPFVRYDIGDLATLSEGCGCGHDGPVLSNILQRDFLSAPTAALFPFLMKAENILKIVKCDEYRIRQTEVNTIEVEIGGIGQLTADQMASLKSAFQEHAGDEFQIRINAVQNINWGNDIKRLGFRSELL